jgi:hypothetical protein
MTPPLPAWSPRARLALVSAQPPRTERPVLNGILPSAIRCGGWARVLREPSRSLSVMPSLGMACCRLSARCGVTGVARNLAARQV